MFFVSAIGNLSSKSTLLAVSKSKVITKYVISWVNVVPVNKENSKVFDKKGIYFTHEVENMYISLHSIK